MIGLMDWKSAGACLLSLEEGSLEEGSRSTSRECEKPERSLLQLECRLAQQSLELSRLELRNLHLNLQPFSSGEGERSLLPILDTTTVAEALEQAVDGQSGQLLLVLGQQGSPK